MSSSKRRKTSPTTSVPINAPLTPSRIPVPRQDGSKGLPGRPSFASPTKASLSRHHPQLLKRPSSSGAGAGEQAGGGNDLDGLFARALSEKLPSGDGNPAVIAEGSKGAESQEVVQTGNELPAAGGRTTSRPPSAGGGGLSAKPRRMSRSPHKSPAKRVAFNAPVVEKEAPVGMDEDFDPFRKRGLRRSPIASQNTEVLPEEPNPFRKSGLRRSPVASQTSQSLPQFQELPVSTTPTAPIPPQVSQVAEPITQPNLQPREKSKRISAGAWQELFPEPTAKPLPPNTTRQPEEPELPPTPTQRGIPDPVVTTPPTGIHGVHGIQNTPSRGRKKAARAAKFKTSPLKPQDERPPEPAKGTDTAPAKSPQEHPAQDLQEKPPEKAQEKPPQEQSARRRSSRFPIPEDPHAAKKKIRDDLLQELRQLESDIVLANTENVRLSEHHETQRGPAPAPPNPSELLSLLLRTTEQPAKPAPKEKSVFENIDMFLPFFARVPPAPEKDVPEKPLPSHLPVEVDDPLPYLQAFSPLRYTSNIITIPRPSSPDSPSSSSTSTFLQRHLISATHPSGLFCARLSMDVDPSSLCITSLAVNKLDPAAVSELGTFLNHQIENETLLCKDISVLCWAMARWTEASIQRARFWCVVEAELGSVEGRGRSLHKLNTGARKRKRSQGLFVDEEEEDEVEQDGQDNEFTGKTQKFTRRQLLPHMGRTSMEISSTHVGIRVQWQIKFDWTGEVESVIDADVRVPGSWTQEDERNSLTKIPEMFRRLVKQKGPLKAVRTVVALLMGEEGD